MSALAPILPGGGRATRPRRARSAAVVLLGAVALAGCGLRLETPPPQAPTPSRAEELRQQAAADSAALAATVAEVTAPGDGAAVLERVEGDIEAQLEALGGVWVAWPEGPPEGATPPPPPPTAPVPDPDVQDVVELLTTSAAEAREAALTAPTDDLAALLASVSISRGRAAADLAGAVGAPPVEVAGAAMSPETMLARGVDGPTVQVLDQARYAWEFVAARSTDAAREQATARAVQLQALVDVAIQQGAADHRLEAYAVPAPEEVEEQGLAAEQAAVVAAEGRLLEHWLFSLGRAGSDVRAGLVDAAAASAARIVEAGGTLPALPGLPTD